MVQIDNSSKQVMARTHEKFGVKRLELI